LHQLHQNCTEKTACKLAGRLPPDMGVGEGD
jgi:hypothetical protein